MLNRYINYMDIGRMKNNHKNGGGVMTKIMFDVPDYIREIVDAGVKVELKNFIIDNQNVIGLRMEGFCKSGFADFIPSSQPQYDFIIITRYGRKDGYSCIQDILKINMDWWEKSKGLGESWNQPDSRWAPLLVKYGFIKEVKTTTYEKV